MNILTLIIAMVVIFAIRLFVTEYCVNTLITYFKLSVPFIGLWQAFLINVLLPSTPLNLGDK